MKVFNTTIKRMENEQVTKTVLVDDPETGEKKTVEYQTHEWQEKAARQLKIPNTPYNLQVLSQIASSAGFNLEQKRPDANIRYQVETQLVDDPTAKNKDVDMWFVCPNCNEVEFDITANIEKIDNTTNYHCSTCGTKLAYITK